MTANIKHHKLIELREQETVLPFDNMIGPFENKRHHEES